MVFRFSRAHRRSAIAVVGAVIVVKGRNPKPSKWFIIFTNGLKMQILEWVFRRNVCAFGRHYGHLQTTTMI